MTTIAYHHESKIIAVDSYTTSDARITNQNAEKWLRIGGDLIVLCGAISDIKHFVEAYRHGKCEAEDVDVTALVVRNGELNRGGVHRGNYWEEPINHNDALGSGSAFALAALDFKMTAKEAVQYASTRCIFTGGTVHAFSAVTGEKVNL